MKKPTYVINLTEKDIKKLLKGKNIKLRFLDFNLELEQTNYHRISCISQIISRAGKRYKQ